MIRLRGINKTYTKNETVKVQALQDVSLDVEKGEFVAIVGPSGSGKSTLMNIIGLLDSPDSGEYILEDEEVGQMNVDDLAEIRNSKIGFVFQIFHLLPRTSAIENVELPLIYSDRSDFTSWAFKALETVGLQDRIDHLPGELSGGQQQRVAIARALVNEPDIILADEPTGNLDTRSGLETIRIFQDLHKKGKSIILITHDEKIASHADRIINIVDGRITSDVKVDSPKKASVELSKLPPEEDIEKNEESDNSGGESR